MLKNLKIKSFLIISLALISILAIVSYGFILLSVDNVLKENLIERGKTEVANIVKIQADTHIPKEIFSEPDLTKTQNAFNDFFHEINTDDILRIKVWDKNARIISSNDQDIVGKIFSDNKPFQEAIKGKVVVEIKAPVGPENVKEQGYEQLMEVYVPIHSSNGEVVGVVEIYTLLDSINEQVSKAQIDLMVKAMAVSIPVIILLCGLFIALYRKVSRSIDALSKFAKILGSGRLSERLDFESHDELSAIAIEMNKMGKSLNEMLISRSELEKQVIERTSEIQSKVSKIERMNRLMVDRELSMVKLKKEVASLKSLLENTSK